MKKMKIALLALVLSCVLPILNVKAVDGFIGLLGVNIPRSSSSWYYTGLHYNKTQDSKQWYYNSGAVDQLTGNTDQKISGRTWDGKSNSKWITLTKNTYVTWGDAAISSGLNFFRGKYGMDIKRNSSALAVASHSGSWYLNENKKPR